MPSVFLKRTQSQPAAVHEAGDDTEGTTSGGGGEGVFSICMAGVVLPQTAGLRVAGR